MAKAPKYVKHRPDGTLSIPKQIPKRRKNIQGCVTWPFTIFCLLAAFCLTSSAQDLILLAAKMVLLLYITEIFHRSIMCVVEFEFLINRYDNKVSKLLYAIFGNSKTMFSGVCFAALVTFSFWKEQSNESWAVILLVVIHYTLSPILEMKQSPIYTSIEISSSNSANAGALMAVSYFYGFLKVLLPANSQANRGLKYFMGVYEERHQITFARQALYILVPLSMSCPFRLNEISAIMDEANTLIAVEEDRAGVKNRNYKNSVYKIKLEDGYIYVAAEYASPLKTFDESVRSNDVFGSYYTLHKIDILWEFYLTLLKLVEECEETRGLVEFIFYPDYDEKDRPVDVGQLLLQRLNDDKNKYSEKPYV